MAIYHLHVKPISRTTGKSAVACAAYRHAAKLFDERENKHWDYQKKSGVLHKEILVPAHAPSWALALAQNKDVDQASEKLWNLVEHHEKRLDAQLAREVEFALPIELSQEQNIALAREFIHDQFVLRGMVTDWSLHWDDGNPHVHVMLTMRSLEETGFGLKVREWNKKELLNEWREKWAEYANFHLHLNQHAVCIDHRSYEKQGIHLVPSTHQGKAVTDMDRRGIATDIMQEANAVRRENLARIAHDPKVILNKIVSQYETFTPELLSQELGRYINDRGKFSQTDLLDATTGSFEDPETFIQKTHANRRLTPDIIAQILRSIEHHESVFTDRHIAKALAPFTDHAESFAAALLQVKASPELLAVGKGEDGRERFTTRRMFDIENSIQKTAGLLRKSTHVKISSQRIQAAITRYQLQTGKELTEEQAIAVKHISRPTAISCIVGRAGTGKSFSLGAAKAIWEAQGLRVQGVALSGIAADGLAKDAAIPSRTIQSFQYAIQTGQVVLTHHDVIVMDEAGMTDSVSMLGILKSVHEARAKLVLVGDHAQIQPVGPGATFRALVERLGFAEIQTIYRQNIAWQRKATVAFSAGRVTTGLKDYAAKNCIHLTKNDNSAMSRLVSDWLAQRNASEKSLDKYLVIAHRNADVQELNSLLRAERIKRNEIAEGYTVMGKHGEMKIAHGDRLLFLKNDRRLGVNNGRFATVQSVQFTELGRVTGFSVMLDGSNKETFINPKEYAEFTHGYAATVHKVQGMTVDHSFVYGSGYFWNRHLTYVAMSRHRESCELYAPDKNLAALTRRLGRVGIKDSLLDFPLAFADRRGLDISSLFKEIPKLLTEKMRELKNNLIHKIEQIFHGKQPDDHKHTLPIEIKPETSLDTILLHYIEMELKQTALVADMHAARLKAPVADAVISSNAIAHANSIKLWVTEALQVPEIKSAVDKIKGIKSQSLAQRGGFTALKKRLETNQLTTEDYHTLITQLKNKAQDQGISKTQDRDRGGRSR